MDTPRRAPALEKSISQITGEDIRIRLVGTVSESGSGYIVVEDGTGNIRVDTEKNFETGSSVRVIGRPVKNGEGLELSSEIIQDIRSLNQKLYKTLMSLTIN